MYLDLRAIEASLSVIAQRSAPSSRLIIFYHQPAWILHLVGFGLRRLGEPLRSSFRADEMRALLGKHGFSVVRDADMPSIGEQLGGELGRSTALSTFAPVSALSTGPRIASGKRLPKNSRTTSATFAACASDKSALETRSAMSSFMGGTIGPPVPELNRGAHPAKERIRERSASFHPPRAHRRVATSRGSPSS